MDGNAHAMAMARAAAPPYAARSYDFKPLPPPHPPIHSPSAYHPPPPPAPAADSAAFLNPYEVYSLQPHPLHSYHHDHLRSAPPPSHAVHHHDPEQQRIHTLFVAGLPDDVKPREIHNLFRRRPGFESCQLKYTGRGDQVVAFATFFNHQSAMASLNELNGTVFDLETGATLHIELARSNSRTKRPRGGGGYTIIDKRVKVTNEDRDQDISSEDGDGGFDEPSGTDNDISSNKDALAPFQSGDSTSNQDGSQATKDRFDKPGEIPSCSTLFIANLGPSCTEQELKQELSTYAGFQTLKMRRRGAMPVAFADFVDVESSTAAMNSLQGSLLASSDRGGLHLEYARSKMRKK